MHFGAKFSLVSRYIRRRLRPLLNLPLSGRCIGLQMFIYLYCFAFASSNAVRHSNNVKELTRSCISVEVCKR